MILAKKRLVVKFESFVGQVSDESFGEADVSHQAAEHYQILELVTNINVSRSECFTKVNQNLIFVNVKLSIVFKSLQGQGKIYYTFLQLFHELMINRLDGLEYGCEGGSSLSIIIEKPSYKAVP